jgi:hypothetical protein
MANLYVPKPCDISAEPKLNSYLFLRKASIGATTTAFGDKMYKNNFAQVLSTAIADVYA